MEKKEFWYGPKGDLGVLLIHGFTGTPKEMEPLAKYLAKKGLRCVSVRLKGHGKKPESLLNCGWEDWLDDVERGFQLLKKDGCKKTWIVGYSLGAPLATAYALKNKEVKGLCLLSPTIMRIPLLKFLGDIGALFERWMFVRFKLQTHYLHYTKVPLKAAREVVRCFEKFQRNKKTIKLSIPVLVIHGEHDEVSTPEQTRKLLKKIESEEKEIKVIKNITHGLVVDEGKEKVFKKISSFIEKNSKNT